MDSIIGLAEFIIGAVVVLIALALIILVFVSRMPVDNPLRQVLSLLIARLGNRGKTPGELGPAADRSVSAR